MLRAVRTPLFFALGALAVLLVAMESVWPGFFLHDDNATWFAGAYAQDFRTLMQTGRLAEVNFFQYGGEPFLEQGQTAVLYPPVYVAAALAALVPGDLRGTVDWLAAIHLALAVTGFYAWARRGGVEARLAALGGMVWALNPFVLLLGASWIMVTAAAAWLPWLFWGVDLIVTPPGTPPGCGPLFYLFRGCRAPAEPGALNPRLRLWQAFGLRGGEREKLPADVGGSRRTPGDGRGEGGNPDSDARVSTSPVPGGHGLPLTGTPEPGGEGDPLPSPAPGGRRLPLNAIPLGVIAGMLVLQGYVQFAAYAFLFAGMYGAFWIFAAGSPRPPGAGRGDFGEPDTGLRSSTSPVPGTHVSRHGLPRKGTPDPAEEYDKFPSPSPGGRRLPLAALTLALLIALALALPQVLPLVRGAAESKMRAQVLTPMFELFYRVEPGDLLPAQFGFFRQHFLFDASTALFFCPALVLLPVSLVRFARGDAAVRRRLFPLILLAVIALVFSGRGYFLLNVLPFMAKFRWPFKVFLFAEFFMVAALVWGCGDFGESDSRLRASTSPVPGGHGLPRMGLALLTLVVVLEVGMSLAEHDTNFLSAAVLPARADLPAGLDATRGRVMAIGGHLPVGEAYRFLTHAYGTYYEVPSLGGYDPLVSPATLEFACGLDIPNFYDQPVTREMQAELESRAVRYWIVQADSIHLIQKEGAFGGLAGFAVLSADSGNDYSAPSGLGSPMGAKTHGFALGYHVSPLWASRVGTPGMSNIPANRLILEDRSAEPMAFDVNAPKDALPVRYAGNSMLIQLSGAAGTVAVSVGPTEGWWYRVDGAGWQQSRYSDFRLQVPVGAGSRELEVSYFDPELREGARISLMIMILLVIFAFILPRYWRKSAWGR